MTTTRTPHRAPACTDPDEELPVTEVRSSVHPGFLEITGPDVVAVVEVAERHREPLEAAAADGMVVLLDLLCSRGLLVMPSFALASRHGESVRVLLRGTATAVLGDGTVLSAEGRLPWREVEVDVAAAGGSVTVASPEPEPEVARGWRRPARLRGAAVAGPEVAAAVREPEPEVIEPDPEPEVVEPEVVEPAAAEAEPEVVPEPEPEPQPEPEPEVVPEPEPEVQPEPEPEPEVAVEEPAPVIPPADLTLPPPEDSAGAPPVQRVPPTPPPDRSIIDSVPWRKAGGEPIAAEAPAVPIQSPAPAPAPEPTPPPPPPVEHTVAPEPEPEPEEPTPAEESPVADVTTSRATLPRSDEDLDRPVVLAVLCPAGHHSPPHAGRCRTCQREIPPQQPTPIPRPPLGVLRISTGGVVPLDRGVLLGRAPRVNEELPANQRPHLIRVGGVDRDISRNHAEVVLEGWHVLVRDLGSTNGTTVTLPGEEPVRLRPTEDQGIEPGTVITLADEVSLTYEVEG
jgi:FHA domain-containing protein